MTTGTDTREDHLIDAAQRADDVVVLHHTSQPITLAQVDGDLIRGVQVLKVGTFNGVVEVTAEDVDLFAARFHELASAGIFTPPMRIDHSWDVLSVVGWFEDLRVEEHPDPTNGDAPTPYLVGDFRLVGTAAEKQQLREWIKTGKLRNRSSEIMPYRTNTGREYARIFAGCAFVDIPAVEGLAPIQLRTDRATLGNDSSTHTEGGAAVADSTEQDRTEDETVVTPATSADSAGSAESAGTPDEADEGEGITVGDAEPEQDDDEDQEADQEEHLQASPGLAAALRAAGLNDASPEVLAAVREAFHREVQRERTADERLTRYTEKGVIPLSVKDRVEALLRHDDDDVRDAVAALLDLASPRVPLGDHAGTQTSEQPTEGTTTTPDELRELTGTEFGDAWAALTSEQRKDPAYLAAYNEAMGTTEVLTAPRS